MADIFEIRRDNLRRIIRDNGGPTSTSKKLPGNYSPSYLSQLAGPKPTRKIFEETAREIEKALRLEERWMETERDEFDRVVVREHPITSSPAEEAAAAKVEMREAIVNVLEVAAEAKAKMTPTQVAELVMLATEKHMGRTDIHRVVSLLGS